MGVARDRRLRLRAGAADMTREARLRQREQRVVWLDGSSSL